MSELNIEFRQMFLLVNRTNGATVLLPASGHTATLAGSMLDKTLALTNADLLVRRDGADLADLPTRRPGARYLPYLDYVFHADVMPLPLSKDEVSSDLNARVTLAGGYLTELPAADANVAKLEWNFVKPDGRITLTQPLTDRLSFTLTLDPASKYQLIIRQNGEETSLDIPAEGASFVVLNADTAPKPQAPDGVHKLVEYALLYNLTTASELSTLYPIPEANTGVNGGDQPICGGGQTDDDPPPGSRRR